MSSAILTAFGVVIGLLTIWVSVVGGDALQRRMFARWGDRLIVDLAWGVTVAVPSVTGQCVAAALLGLAPVTRV